MARALEFSPEIEREVRFVEETEADALIGATAARLEAGTEARGLLAAAGLAVSRSTELPPEHHGGPVHPVSGLHAVSALSRRLEGESRHLPVIQSLALANKHVNAPDMGPFVMPELDPQAIAEGEDPLAGLLHALVERHPLAAERHLLAALESASHGEILDTLLRVALPRNALDDHYLLYPVYAFRALDAIGWDWAPVILRPVVRFLARHPLMEPAGGFKPEEMAESVALYQDFGRLERLIETHGLTADRVPLETGAGEDEAIAELADQIATVRDIRAVVDLLAGALTRGLSLKGTGEALSAGGARIFLRAASGNPFDVHIHTGVNARRYIIGLDGVAFERKILALLCWPFGPEIRVLDWMMTWPEGATSEELAGVPAGSAEALLDALAESIVTQPALDIGRIEVPIAELPAAPQMRRTIALAQAYAEAGHDPAPFFRRLAELTCREDQSEMHAYKMQQAAYEEFHATRPPHRWAHMVSAAKHAACVGNLGPRNVYPAVQARRSQ